MGDIHGCSDLLDAILAEISAIEPSGGLARVVFLGDYVDRGPDSRGVLETLSMLSPARFAHAEFIRGNHDHLMLAFLTDVAAGRSWQQIGGDATLLSFGVAPPPKGASSAAWLEAHTHFKAVVPEHHQAFLRNLKPSLCVSGVFLTHAGVNPRRSLSRQKETDLMWIRNGFLHSRRQMERLIVHGHTPTSEPYSDGRRIGVDTGAYASGILTAVRLNGDERKFLQVRRVTSTADGTATIAPYWDVRPTDVA